MIDHHFKGAAASCIYCACGHVEHHCGKDTFLIACQRMNLHIRESLGEEEWEARVKRSHMAVLNPTTGDLKKLTRD